MVSKKFFLFFIILVVNNLFYIYSQEQNEYKDNEFISIDESPIIELSLIEKNSIFSRYPYKLANGTGLSYQDTLQILKPLKINEILLKEEREYRIASNVLLVISGMGCSIYLLYFDRLKNDIWGNILIGSSAGVGVSSLITYGIAEKKINKAVHNYNLYVMGIQININNESK
jgi:hypothetical protein